MISTTIDAMSIWKWTAIAAVSSAVMAIFTGATLFHNLATQRLTVRALRDEMTDRDRLAKGQARRISIRSEVDPQRQNFGTGVGKTQVSAHLSVSVENKSNDTIDHVEIELEKPPVMPVEPDALAVHHRLIGQQRAMPRASHPTLTYRSSSGDEMDPFQAIPLRGRFFALRDLQPDESVELNAWIPAPHPSKTFNTTVKFTTANSRRFSQGSDGEPKEID